MSNKIKLQNIKCKEYSGSLKYIIYHNTSIGLINKYDVVVLGLNQPFTIGQELDLNDVKQLIFDYELCFKIGFKNKFNYLNEDFNNLLLFTKLYRNNLKEINAQH